MNWQPIETAPKDGRSIVLYCEAADEILHDCIWEDDQWKVWEFDGFYDDRYCVIYHQPTHWFEITKPGDE
jgi:hypothetical protein